MKTYKAGSTVSAEFTTLQNCDEEELINRIKSGLSNCGESACTYATLSLTNGKNKAGKTHRITGRLANSLAYSVSGEPATAVNADNPIKGEDGTIVTTEYTGTEEEATGNVYRLYIGTSVEYAPYVELGTSQNAAYPYLRPALEDHTSVYIGMIEGETGGKVNFS